MNESPVWDRLAGRYDSVVRLFDGAYPEVRERLADDIRPRAEILEVGAGTGQFTWDLARSASRVLATDLSVKMVEQLQVKAAETGASNVTVATMSAYAIESPPDGFDVVFCANALHVMETPERALAEFRRVLRPDGLLIAPTFLHGVDSIRRTLSRALGLVSPFTAHTRFDRETLGTLLKEHGFEVVRLEVLSSVFPIGYVVAVPS